jgi:DUF2950 family protein
MARPRKSPLHLLLAVEPVKICLSKLCLVSAVLVILGVALLAQESGQKTFASADEASQALLAANETHDQDALVAIFGPDADKLISTGDSFRDQTERDDFVAKYKEMHRLAQEPDGTTTLYTGTYNWPFPVPLVYEHGVWYFDTEAGEKEILYRRIGDNEFAAMDVCYELVNAEAEYYSQLRDGKTQQYAQSLASDPGQHNGLFWETTDDEPESPIGPLIANAVGVDTGKQQTGESSPFHGYYYRILTGQGKTARHDAQSYIVNGAMTRGFGIVAYPADYRSSGVMTFVVNKTGVIYQKDLGPDTPGLASAMKEYAPDETWRKADQ